MALSLATKYRPKTFEDVVGQEWVVKILKKQIERNEIKNCYLFCGTSGTGKTTLARIVANEINKGKGSPIEIDAASNSGVDNVSIIIDSSNTKSISGEYRIYIIDEAHALSNTAWQAFLKTLEEPSAKSIFMFCTTEVQKVPETILNRVQRFDLTKLNINQIYQRLCYICEQEGFKYEPEALHYISKLSKGRMRDAIASLEKVASLNSFIKLDDTNAILDGIDYKTMFGLTNFIIDRKVKEVLDLINFIDVQGKDIRVFINNYIDFILDVNKYLVLESISNLDIPDYHIEDLKYTVQFNGSKEFFLNALEELIKLKETIRYDSNPRTALEITCLKLCK